MKKILLIISIVLFPFVSNAGGGCNNVFPVVSPDGQRLYFSSDRHGGNYEIYSSDIDGISNLVRLTNTTVNNYYPSVSPDGQKIVFQSGDYGTSAEVFIMNSDGTGLTNLTNNSIYDGYPNFSPDGQTIVFDGWDVDTYPEIFTMNVNGTNRTQLTNVSGAYWQCSPIYNPSGTYIYFSLGYNADNHLARMDLNGSNIIDITPANTFGIAEFGMHFSPDATHLVFSTTEWEGYNNGSDIVISDTMGGNWNRITNAAAGDWYHSPVWHPSNNKLYYSLYQNSTSYYEIYEMNSTGTGINLLSDCSNVGFEALARSEEIISVFPNPASNELNLDMPTGVYVEFYDIEGRFIFNSTDRKIDISSMESGYYTLRFVGNDGVLIQNSKLIKE